MDDLVMRLIVAGGIAGIASVAAIVSRRGRAWRRRPFESTGLEPGIHLFSSESCGSCHRARSVIERTGLSFSEHTYESAARVLEENRIDRVPSVAWVPSAGGSGWVAEGIPTERTLVRWVGP
jgi:hypothetical protein